MHTHSWSDIKEQLHLHEKYLVEEKTSIDRSLMHIREHCQILRDQLLMIKKKSRNKNQNNVYDIIHTSYFKCHIILEQHILIQSNIKL